MQGIYSASNLAQSISDILSNGFNKAGELAGHAVNVVTNLPAHMQANRNVAVGTFRCCKYSIFHDH